MVLETIAIIATILGTFGTGAYWLGKKFAMIDERFRQMDERFRQVDERFRQVDERFRQMDERFKSVNGTIERFMSLSLSVIKSVSDFQFSFLSYKGIISKEDASFGRDEVGRVIEIATGVATANPLTKEEWKFMYEIGVKKPLDEITIEEIERFIDLAYKLAYEDPKPEYLKMAYVGHMIKGYIMQKIREKKSKSGL